MKQISFCITCMNRLKHLQETLEKNILDNFLVDEVEFVVLDYNSQDGLEEWIAQSMMKYIEMGILVYYRTTEPAYYRRSHSRNMVFRLAEGEVVCNLDADNYLGRGFAEFMLKEFNNKERLFYTSNLCYRDVFGRVCLERKEFVEARGYNEVFVGYGLEDVEFFNRLLCRGLVQEIFNQKEFYNVLMHADEERIAQEFLLKKLQSVYLDYINPYSTRVLMLYKGQRFGIGVIQNNIAMNYNHPDESDMLKQCIGDKYRLVIKGEWKEGYDYLEKAITAEDSHDFALPSLYANAALCLHKMGKKRKAHQYCKKAYDLAPEEIDPYLIEGRIYMEEGEYEKGVKKWAKALEYAPYADTWHEIGMCSMEIGQLSYAKLAFEHVKEMEPDFEGINERLTSLYMLLKDKENFMKYNQLCEHPFRLEELDKLQQILQEDNQEELALVMKNIFNALQ